jgi:hypothetical protein
VSAVALLQGEYPPPRGAEILYKALADVSTAPTIEEDMNEMGDMGDMGDMGEGGGGFFGENNGETQIDFTSDANGDRDFAKYSIDGGDDEGDGETQLPEPVYI